MGPHSMSSDGGRPLILISAGHHWDHDYWIETLAPALVSAGADVRPLSDFPSEDERREAIRRAGGMLLGGGLDIDPVHYGEEMSSLLGPLDRERDEVELPLTREAFDLGLPLLGICRGMQVISVSLGGTMYRDASENPTGGDHPSGLGKGFVPSMKAVIAGGEHGPLLTHEVSTTPGSLAADFLGENAAVNSYHHQHLRDLPDGVVATTRAGDGVIEAIEIPDAPFVVGVQWELQASWPGTAEVGFLERFVAAAHKKAGH